MKTELNRQQRTKKYIIYCLLVGVTALVQNTAGLTLQIGSARCFLLIPITVILIAGEDEGTAALIGLFAGLLWDIDSAVHMGFNGICLMLMCFFISAAIVYVVRNTFATNMIFCTGAVLIYVLLYWLFFIVIKNIDAASDTLFTFYIPSAVYTLLLSPVFWLILKPIKKKLCKF